MLWRDLVVIALENLQKRTGKTAFNLNAIYEEVYKLRSEIDGERWDIDKPNWKAKIRQVLQHHNPDMPAYIENSQHLFISNEKGVWGLKDTYAQDQQNEQPIIITNTNHTQYKCNQYYPVFLCNLYDYTCQISGERLSGNNKVYAEVHHIKPLHKGGADLTQNMLVVTPSIHAMLDNMMRPLKMNEIFIHREHKIDKEMLDWHNQIYYAQSL